jgi:hypothetical protein
VRPRSGGVVKNRIGCPDIRHHHARMPPDRQHRENGRELLGLLKK